MSKDSGTWKVISYLYKCILEMPGFDYKVLKDNCIIEYNFSDNDGITIRDSSGNQNNGIIVASVIWITFSIVAVLDYILL